jgi:hypothetical protein
MKKTKLSLINHEGDCLWAIRSGDDVVVYDQWEDLVEILNVEKFCLWLDGETGLTDSHGKTWYWTKESREAKPSMWKLINFLK